MRSIERFYVYDYSLLCIRLSDSTCSSQRLYAYDSVILPYSFVALCVHLADSMRTFRTFYHTFPELYAYNIFLEKRQ